MHRRRRRFLVLAAGVLAVRPVLAVDLLEGVDYSVIPQQPVAPGRRIQVVEFFYYGCRWCNELQPYLEEWLNRKPADVDFRYQPAIRSKRWLVLTKAFFALQAMGEVQRLHARIYRAYHREGVNLEDEAVLTGWLLKQGVELKPFEQQMSAPETMAKVEAARSDTYSYQVDSTPSICVSGRYLTNSGMAGGVVPLMQVLEDLVVMARQQRP